MPRTKAAPLTRAEGRAFRTALRLYANREPHAASWLHVSRPQFARLQSGAELPPKGGRLVRDLARHLCTLALDAKGGPAGAEGRALLAAVARFGADVYRDAYQAAEEWRETVAHRPEMLPPGVHVAPFTDADGARPVLLAVGPHGQLWNMATVAAVCDETIEQCPPTRGQPARRPRVYTPDVAWTSTFLSGRALANGGHRLLPPGVHRAPWRVVGYPLEAVELVAIGGRNRLVARVVVASGRAADLVAARKDLAAVLDLDAAREAGESDADDGADDYTDGYGRDDDDSAEDFGDAWKA